jgi:hypothetical protein
MRALEAAVALGSPVKEVAGEGLLAVGAADLDRSVRRALFRHALQATARASGQRDRLDAHVVLRLVARPCLDLFDRVDDVHAGGHAPEDGVLAVEPRT